LKEKRELVNSIHRATFITIGDMDNVKALEGNFIVRIESLLKNAEFAITEEGFVKLMMDEIKKTVAMFMETLEESDGQARSCHRHIIQGRTVILKRINYARQ
jgi:predicted nucleic-acid-binding protein